MLVQAGGFLKSPNIVVLLNTLPTLILFSAYMIVLLSWAQLYHSSYLSLFAFSFFFPSPSISSSYPPLSTFSPFYFFLCFPPLLSSLPSSLLPSLLSTSFPPLYFLPSSLLPPFLYSSSFYFFLLSSSSSSSSFYFLLPPLSTSAFNNILSLLFSDRFLSSLSLHFWVLFLRYSLEKRPQGYG
jgi:hypothetical protein